MAEELPISSRIMQTGYNSKEFRERNLILVRVMKLEIFCIFVLQKKFVSNEPVMPYDYASASRIRKKFVLYKTVSSKIAPG